MHRFAARGRGGPAPTAKECRQDSPRAASPPTRRISRRPPVAQPGAAVAQAEHGAAPDERGTRKGAGGGRCRDLLLGTTGGRVKREVE